MIAVGTRSLIALWIVVLQTTSPSIASAGWTTDPGSSGLLVRGGGTPRAVVSDGAGGALIGFGEYFGSNTIQGMVVQRLDLHGQLPWGNSGVPVGYVGSLVGDYGPVMAPDGTGGAVVLWRGVDGVHLHGQRVSSSGIPQWTPVAPGEGTYVASGSPWPLWVGRDGLGSFVTVWLQNATLFAQRFDGDGTLLWGPQGIDLGIPVYSRVTAPVAVGDGRGGLIVFWTAPGPLGNRDVFAQRFGANGSPMWSSAGVAICAADGDQGSASFGLAAVDDGAGGACVAWIDQRSDAQGDVYAQRINGSGGTQWTQDGVALCAVPGSQSNIAVVAESSGGLIAAWQDTRDASTGIDLYAQSVGGGGSVRWAEGGAIVCNAPGDQTVDNPSGTRVYAASDGAGGLFAAWTDARPDGAPGNDIFAQHLDLMGQPTFVSQGLRFGSTSTPLGIPAVMPDGLGGCAVLWSGSLSLRGRGSNVDGSVIGVDPMVSTAFALHCPRPNPATGPFGVEFSIAEPGAVRLEVFDVAGRRVWRGETHDPAPGAHLLQVGALKPGLYMLRLRQGSRVATTRAVVLR